MTDAKLPACNRPSTWPLHVYIHGEIWITPRAARALAARIVAVAAKVEKKARPKGRKA